MNGRLMPNVIDRRRPGRRLGNRCLRVHPPRPIRGQLQLRLWPRLPRLHVRLQHLQRFRQLRIAAEGQFARPQPKQMMRRCSVLLHVFAIVECEPALRLGKRSVPTSMTWVAPVLTTAPAVGTPTRWPRFSVLIAWLKISALLPEFWLQRTTAVGLCQGRYRPCGRGGSRGRRRAGR